MITVVAVLKINMEKEAEAISAIEALCKGVEELEAGAVTYLAHRSVDHPDEVVFVEKYADEEAFKAHRKTPHMAEMNKVFKECFIPPVEVTQLREIAGFTR